MADTWEDSWEDFDLGDKAASQIPGDSAESVDINGKGNGLAWDDEEEPSEGEEYAASAAISKKMKAKVMAQSRNSEAARVAAKYEASVLANENPEERRLRERVRVEETEKALAAELLGEQGIANVSISGEKASGIEGMKVNTLEEHVELAIDVALKLKEKSNSECITVFLKEVISRLQKRISFSQLEMLLKEMTAFQDEKRASEEIKTANTKKQELEKKKRQDAKKKKQVHHDLFGGDYDTLDNEYDEMAMYYADKYEQDFM